MKYVLFFAGIFAGLLAAGASPAADGTKDDDAYAPHTPMLIFHLTALTDPKDADAINAAVTRLPGVRKVSVDPAQGYALVRFDSHVVSYHQVAQAIADAGAASGKQFDPRLKIQVPDYAKGENAGKVDAIFAGKRLNQRVHVEPLDKAKGEFLVHFLPLKIDSAARGPQGFNGGHLHHPINDPPPRGLGLEMSYETPKSGAATSEKQH